MPRLPILRPKIKFNQQFTDEPPSNIPQTAYLRIDDEIKHIWESQYQADSNFTATDGVNSLMQSGAEIAVEISDADELAGVLSSSVVEPATTNFYQPPSKESPPEEIAQSQIQVAGIAELSHPVAITAIEIVQLSPPENIDVEHITDEIASTSSLETESDIDEQFTDEVPFSTPQIAYSRIDVEIKPIMNSKLQSDSDITSAEGVDSPVQADEETSAEISDADELAGIWPTEAIEPAVLDSEQLLSSEVTSEEIVASQIHVARGTDLIEPVQHDANQVEPEYLPAPTFLALGINQTTSDLDKETTNDKTVGLNDSSLVDQMPLATDQLAYAIPKIEPTPIREEFHATYKTPLKDVPQRETDPPEITTTEQIIEPEVDESETKRKEAVSDTAAENQPEFDNSSPLTIQESSDHTELAETDQKLIPKERHQVASIDPVQPTVNSSDQGTTNTVTQKIDLGGISSDVGAEIRN